MFKIAGTPATAGFGLVGLVGPIGAFKGTEAVAIAGPALVKVLIIVLVFILIPLIVALASDFVYRKKLHLYEITIFENNGGM